MFISCKTKTMYLIFKSASVLVLNFFHDKPTFSCYRQTLVSNVSFIPSQFSSQGIRRKYITPDGRIINYACLVTNIR